MPQHGLALALLSAAVIMLLAPAAQAVTCQSVRHDGNRYTICRADIEQDQIELYRADEDGDVYGDFFNLRDALRKKNRTLVFAMNGGMYHEDRSPVGHYVENGREDMRVIANAGPGNFGLLPNGVFCVQDDRADVIETRTYLARKPACNYATQSGPMLVIKGDLHPRFLPDSDSRFIRNGVGTSADGQEIVFAISENSVTFHSFARFFRDGLGLPNALFLDGNVSRLFAADLRRSDSGRRMGPILAITQPRTE